MSPAFRRFLRVALPITAILVAMDIAGWAYACWGDRLPAWSSLNPMSAYSAWKERPRIISHAMLTFDAHGVAALEGDGKPLPIPMQSNTIIHELAVRAPSGLPLAQVIELLYSENIFPSTNRVHFLVTDNAGLPVADAHLLFTGCEHCESVGRRVLALRRLGGPDDIWEIGYRHHGEEIRLESSSGKLPAMLGKIAQDARTDGIVTQPQGLLLQLFFTNEAPSCLDFVREVSGLNSAEVYSLVPLSPGGVDDDADDAPCDLFEFLPGKTPDANPAGRVTHLRKLYQPKAHPHDYEHAPAVVR